MLGTCDCGYHADAYTYSEINTDADAYSDTYSDTYSHSETNTDANTCSDAYSDTYSDANADADAYTYSDVRVQTAVLRGQRALCSRGRLLVEYPATGC